MSDLTAPPTTIEIRGKLWTLLDAASLLYRRVWSTSYGSNRYGFCEVCRKPADTVWCADFAEAYRLDAADEDDGAGLAGGWGLTQEGVPGSRWGHRECVESVKP